MTESRYRWVIVAAGGLLGCVAIGSMFSLPVLLQPIARDTGWSVTGVSSAMTSAFSPWRSAASPGAASPIAFVPRAVVLTGSIILALSLALASRRRRFSRFSSIFGAPCGRERGGHHRADDGLRHGLVRNPSQPCGVARLGGHGDGAFDHGALGRVARFDLELANHARDPRRGRRLPYDSCGASGAQTAGAGRASGAASDGAPQSGMSVGEALRSPQFVLVALTNFFCCATHSGPIFHTVSYAQTCGIPLVAAVSIYSVEGLAGMGGRIGFGLLGDRFGAKRILVLGLLAQAFGALAYVFARGLGEFYTVAAIFGFIYAGVMPLYAVLARENFPLRMMGTVIGGTAMAGSLGMALGRWPAAHLRRARQLHVALCRLVGDGHRRLPDRHDLQALAEGGADIRRRPLDRQRN